MKNKEKTITAEKFLIQVNDVWNNAKDKILSISDKYVRDYLLDKGFNKPFVDCIETCTSNSFGTDYKINHYDFDILFDGIDINLNLESLLKMDINQILNHIEKESGGGIREDAILALKLERKKLES